MLKFKNMISHKNKHFNNSIVIFLVIAFWYGLNNFVWWMFNTPVMPYSISALHFLDIFREGILFYNAPLLTYIMRFMFFVFGKEYYDLIVIFVNYIFFLVPLYFVYKIALELKDKETGNIAMILFALVPAIYGMTRQYGHKDFHIIAAITFNIYCLIKTNYFKDLKWSIIYGISIGLGLMIKDPFLVYFFVPFLYIVIISLKKECKLSTILNILLLVAISCFIVKWHYFRYQIITKIWYEPITETASISDFESIRVFTVGLWEELLSPPIFLIFIIGLLWFIYKYKKEYKYVILLWIVVPWSIMMFMAHHKLSEYGAGFIPAMVLVGALFLSSIKEYRIKRLILLLVVVIGLVQYIDFSYVIDTKLFNMKCQYKNHTIQYYNKYNDIIKYDKNKTTLTMDLVNYLYKRYPNSKILFEDMPCSPPDTRLLLSQMLLHDKSCIAGNWLVTTDPCEFDIIVYIGRIRTIQEKEPGILLLYVYNYEQYKMLHNYIYNYFIARTNLIKNNFNKVDEFYLSNIKSEQYKITVYKKINNFCKI